MSAQKGHVVIATNLSDETISFLTWNGGRGPKRVYERDFYDPRFGADLPYFDNFLDALSYMSGNPDPCCQIDASLVEHGADCDCPLCLSD